MHNYKNNLVDLSNCNREPIHIIGRIQPHGFLLVIDKATHIVEQVSENVLNFVALSAEYLLGKPICALVTAEEYNFLAGVLQQKQFINPQLVSWQGRNFFCFLHTSGDKIILEYEPYTASSDSDRIKYINLVTQLNEQLHLLDDLQYVSDAVAVAMAEILEYDRVEIIQFDLEWNSEVIGETRTSLLDSYLGHHFPASDIPAPARDLLVKKHIRQIPDVDAEAVDIIPYNNPITGVPTNIIMSELRNPSEIHLEYVKNMGVGATISFSILVKGILWGLISCHNVAPVFIDVWKRQACDLITKTFANVIMSFQETRDIKQMARYRSTEELLIKQINQSKDIREGLLNNERNLLAITESTGVALFLDNQLITFGDTPTQKQVSNLLNWVSQTSIEGIFYTRELSKSIPEAAIYKEVASGLLALEISRYNQE